MIYICTCVCYIFYSDNGFRDLRLTIGVLNIYTVMFLGIYKLFSNICHHPTCLLQENQRKANEMEMGLSFPVLGYDPGF